jgi:hypothetical protein
VDREGVSRIFSATAFAAAALAFALPFGFVSSCDGGEVSFTGAELATFMVPADDRTDRELRDRLESNAGAFAFALLVAALAGLVLSVVGLRGVGLCAAVGVALAQLLLYGIVLSADESSSLFVGYWLALASSVTAAIVALVREVRARRQSGRSAWAPIGYGVAVVLPPVGLVVAGLGALLALLVRWARAPRRLRTE